MTELGVSCLLRLVDLVIANLILICTHNTFEPLAVDPLPFTLTAYTPAGDGKSEVGIVINPCFLVKALFRISGHSHMKTAYTPAGDGWSVLRVRRLSLRFLTVVCNLGLPSFVLILLLVTYFNPLPLRLLF